MVVLRRVVRHVPAVPVLSPIRFLPLYSCLYSLSKHRSSLLLCVSPLTPCPALSPPLSAILKGSFQCHPRGSPAFFNSLKSDTTPVLHYSYPHLTPHTRSDVWRFGRCRACLSLRGRSSHSQLTCWSATVLNAKRLKLVSQLLSETSYYVFCLCMEDCARSGSWLILAGVYGILRFAGASGWVKLCGCIV